MKVILTAAIFIAAVLLTSTCSILSTDDTEKDGTISAPVVTCITSSTFDTTPTWEWTVPEGAVMIRYCLDKGDWQTVDTLSETSYTPSSPLSRGLHVLEVQAADSKGRWSKSGLYAIFIELEAPSGVSASDDLANKITISWSAVSDAVSYHVYRSLSADSGYSEIGDTAALFYDDAECTPGTLYYYRVMSESANAIYSDYSEYDEGMAAETPSGSGTCSMLPVSIEVNQTDQFTTDIYVDSGAQLIAAYHLNVLFDSNIIAVNTGIGSDGVSAGADGFVAAVNAGTPGVLQFSGFDVNGKGPGPDLHLVTIYWTAEGSGTTDITVEVETLVDASYNTIGTPAGVGCTVTVN